MKKTNHSNDAINKIVNICIIVVVIATLLYVLSTVFNAYIDYRIDKFMVDNQVWYRLDECL